MPLHRHKFRKSLFFRQGVGLGKLPGKAVGDPDITGFSLFYNPVQAVHDVIKRRRVIPHMINIQIHMVHSQISEAGIHELLNMLLPGDARFDLFRRAGQEFRRHHHFITAGKIPQGAAQILLAGAALVPHGSIKEIDAQLQPFSDDFPGMLFIHRPTVLPVSCVSESHAAHADAGYVQLLNFQVSYTSYSFLLFAVPAGYIIPVHIPDIPERPALPAAYPFAVPRHFIPFSSSQRAAFSPSASPAAADHA